MSVRFGAYGDLTHPISILTSLKATLIILVIRINGKMEDDLKKLVWQVLTILAKRHKVRVGEL
jgi:hypothetical protein